MKNYKIVKCLGCWGDEMYFGYIDGKLIEEGFDFIEELYEVDENFKNAIIIEKIIKGA